MLQQHKHTAHHQSPRCSNTRWVSLSHRTNRRASEQPVLSHPGHPAGLPPQLCWPHPRLHRRNHRGGRQGFSNVGTHSLYCFKCIPSLFLLEKIIKLVVCVSAALWTRQRTTWRTLKRRRDARPGFSLTEQVRKTHKQRYSYWSHTNTPAWADGWAHTCLDTTLGVHTHTHTPVSNGAGPECANFKELFSLSAAFQYQPCTLFFLRSMSLKSQRSRNLFHRGQLSRSVCFLMVFHTVAQGIFLHFFVP